MRPGSALAVGVELSTEPCHGSTQRVAGVHLESSCCYMLCCVTQFGPRKFYKLFSIRVFSGMDVYDFK